MKKTPVEKHFDEVAKDYDYYKKKNGFYYDNLKKLLRSVILPEKSVFEVGCGTGDLLVNLKPKSGYGFDISEEMIRLARNKHGTNKNLEFSTSWPKPKFDFIFMSDVVEHLENPAKTFSRITESMDGRSIFVNTMMNPIWEPIERVYSLLGLKMPEGPHKRIQYNDVKKLYEVAGLKIVKHDYRLLIPIKIPLITGFVNKRLERYLKKFAFIEYLIAIKNS